MLKNLVFPILLTLLFAFACKQATEVKSGKVLAEAYGEKLYLSDVSVEVPEDISYEDSVFLVQELVNLWVEKRVLLNEADKTLTASEKDKSKELEEFKNDLLIFEVLDKLSESSIDTSFTDVEIEEYYNDNIEDFELVQNIIKVMFYKVPTYTPTLNQLWSEFKKDFKSAHEKLTAISEAKGNNYTDRYNWVLFDDILKEVPINTYNQEHFLSNNKDIRLKDGDYTYFIKIIDFKTRNGVKPFELAKEDIIPVLKLKRQKEMIKEVERNLIKQAYSKNKVRIY